jgi:pSer/pThr/pTyr-binding forkhead associated (FHA) protein
MAKLILTQNDQVIKEFPLNKECLTVGRRPENDIRIENPAISGQHCQIINILNDSFIEDLNSTNGTIVNDRPVKKHALANGDVIKLGEHQLKYVNELASNAAVSDEFAKTMIIRTDAMGMPMHEADAEVEESVEKISEAIAQAEPEQTPEATPEVTEVKRAKLKILNGTNANKELELTKPMTTLGRPGVQVAAITRRDHGYSIVHVEGKEDQFPIINGTSTGKGIHPLNDQDIIEVAGIKMEIRFF